MLRVTAVFISLSLTACMQSDPQTTNVDVEAESEAILKTDRAFSARSGEVGVTQAFDEYLANDALMLPHGGSPVAGGEAIHDLMSSGPEFTMTWEPRAAEVALSGDLGWSWGEYTATSIAEDGSTNTSYGKYVSIWRKQDDGSWKAIVDIGNQSPTP